MARNEKHDRSDRFEQVIGPRLAAERDHCGVLCPDESIIAAYHDRSIGRGERALWERHFAQCARCTSTLAAYARIDDALASGGGSIGRAVADESRAWWRPRAAIPIAAFGAALAVLFVIAIRTITVRPGPLGGEARSEFQEEHLPADAAAIATNPAPIAKSGEALGAGNSLMVMNEAARLRPAAPTLEEPLAAKVTPAPLAAESKARERRRQTSARAEFEDLAERAIKLHKENPEVATAVPPPVPVAAPSPRASSRAVAASDAAASSNTSRRLAAFGAGAPSALATVPASTSVLPPEAEGERVVPASGTGESGSAAGAAAPSNRAAAAGAVAAGVGAAFGGAGLSAGASMRSTHGVVLESPDHSGIWTVGERGAITRYTAAAGWVPQVSGVKVDLTSGSAPSAATCWVIGRGGTILRTVDGEHWTKVIAPVRDDLVNIDATSATDATISTVGGLRFSTSDGGVNWHRL